MGCVNCVNNSVWKPALNSGRYRVAHKIRFASTGLAMHYQNVLEFAQQCQHVQIAAKAIIYRLFYFDFQHA